MCDISGSPSLSLENLATHELLSCVSSYCIPCHPGAPTVGKVPQDLPILLLLLVLEQDVVQLRSCRASDPCLRAGRIVKRRRR